MSAWAAPLWDGRTEVYRVVTNDEFGGIKVLHTFMDRDNAIAEMLENPDDWWVDPLMVTEDEVYQICEDV